MMERRLSAGLESLQSLSLVFGVLFQHGEATLRTYLLKLLHQNKMAVQAIRVVLAEMHDNIGDAGGTVEQERQRGVIRGALVALGAKADFLALLATNEEEQGERGGVPGKRIREESPDERPGDGKTRRTTTNK